jgi:hypothetical protein
MLNIPSISFAAMLVAAGLVTAGLPTIGTGLPQYHWRYHDLAIVPAADLSALEPFRAEQGVAEDAAITAKVKDAITTVVGPGAAEINVETRAAIVTLSGTAPSAAIRVQIREAALTVGGVVDVVDKLEVKSTA